MAAGTTNMEESDRMGHSYDNHPVLEKIHQLYHTLLDHNGFGELRMDIRILKRGQKEVIIYCGKQYRFVVDAPQSSGQEKRQERHECSIVDMQAEKGGEPSDK
jgi:hypothetical protein